MLRYKKWNINGLRGGKGLKIKKKKKFKDKKWRNGGKSKNNKKKERRLKILREWME